MECECCGTEIVSDSVNPIVIIGNVKIKTQGIKEYICYDCDQQYIEMEYLRYLRYKFKNINAPYEILYINFSDPFIVEDMKKFEISRKLNYSKH